MSEEQFNELRKGIEERDRIIKNLFALLDKTLKRYKFTVHALGLFTIIYIFIFLFQDYQRQKAIEHLDRSDVIIKKLQATLDSLEKRR